MKLLRLLRSASKRSLVPPSVEATKPAREPLEDDTVVSENEQFANDSLTKVSFNEAASTMYDCPWQDSEADDMSISTCWYTRADIRLFKVDANVLGTELRLRERQPGFDDKWSSTLLTAYYQCQNLENADDVRALFARARRFGPVDPHCVGLDKWALSEIKAERASIRKNLQDRIYEVQFRSGKPIKQDKEIQRICRDISRTSRFFALFMGKLMVQDAQQTQ
jgi:hypothetical protein